MAKRLEERMEDVAARLDTEAAEMRDRAWKLKRTPDLANIGLATAQDNDAHAERLFAQAQVMDDVALCIRAELKAHKQVERVAAAR